MKFGILLLLSGLFSCNILIGQDDFDTAKPWTYWWWMGSAVNKENISIQLDDFKKAGLGGVHIIPIYGVKGFEKQSLAFLSEEWLALLEYTTQEAEKLNLGLDLTLGTGWPYGGNWINSEFSAKKLEIKAFTLEQSNKILFKPSQLKSRYGFYDLVAAYASNQNIRINLGPYLNNEIVDHEVPFADWEITVFGIKQTKQLVKRAAPGGEGLVMDYFDGKSVTHYLQHFDSVFSNTKHEIHPRAFYHDSYEVYGANWTSQFTEAFKKLQGYELLDHLYILQDTLNAAYPLIIHDIRATLSELVHTEFAEKWTSWSKEHSALTRYQAHGSPSNILDLYGLSSIPETESFGCSNFSIPNLTCDSDYDEGQFGRPSPLLMKFASSPAHLLDKPLVSAETGTWLANHFKVSLRRVKPQIDELFIGGINHIFYHGITYSPKEEGFPGWLFYASTNFGQSSHFWNELPLLNSYIEKCQKLLQEANPDNNILLYFPINDLWTKNRSDHLLLLDVHHYDRWFSNTSFGETAELLWNSGYTFDYVSDKQLSQLKVDSLKNISIQGKSKYQTIVIPAIDYLPETTLDELDRLARQGLKIIFVDKLPEHYSGFPANQANLLNITNTEKVLIENQNFIISENLTADINKLNIRPEELKSKGLDFIRKTNSHGTLYFISNLGNQFLEDTITFSAHYKYITIIDPQTNKRGYIETTDSLYLDIPPGKSYLIQTSMEKPHEERWYMHQAYDTIELNNNWRVSFDNWNTLGLKEVYNIDSLFSWTDWGDEALKSFTGKARYISSFELDSTDREVKQYILRIEDVRETADVIINEIPCGTIWAYPTQLEVDPEILKSVNHIEIIVQNLSSNYMKIYDRENPQWKKFYDINFVDITYTPFNPSEWHDEPSGLIGNIYLVKEK